MTEPEQKVRDLTAISFLVAVVVAFFAKIICSKETLYGSDFLYYFYPAKRFIYDFFCTNGSVPFWNPHLFSGAPLIANMQTSMFYPLGFLYYLMPTDAAYLYSTLLHCSLGAVLMYLFVRSTRISRLGSFLSGFIFVFNGYFIAHIYAGHLSFVQNYIWIPLVFLFARKFMETRELKHAVAGGLVLGIQILGGFPQIAFYTILSVLLLSFYSCCLNFKKHGLPYLFKISGGTFLLLAFGFLLSAIQLLPTYEFTGLSTRAGGVGYEFATMDSLPPRNLLTFVFPLLFGSPVDGTYWISDRTWGFWEYCAYAGIAAMAAIVMVIKKLVRDRMGLFFVLLALTALFLALGQYNPVYPLIYRLPGFDSFRVPAQILFLYVFSISVLIGKAVDILKATDMFQKNANRIVIVILFFCLPLVIGSYAFPEAFGGIISKHLGPFDMDSERLGLIVSVVSCSIFFTYCIFFVFSVCWYLRRKGSISPGMFTGMLMGLCMIDLGSFAFPLIRTFDIRGLLQEGELLSPIIGDSQASRGVILGRCFIKNAGLWYGFQDIQGYDPLVLRRYMEYINRSQGLPPDNRVVNLHYIRDVNNPLIRMLNLKYVVDCQARQIRAYDGFMPRCWIVHHTVEKEKDQILDFMMGRNFHPLTMVVFEKDQSAVTAVSVVSDPVSAGESCQIVSYANTAIHAQVRMNAPGFLVLSEIQYPGWQVYVDGKKKKILTGNYLFRAVHLEPGNHRVRFIFNPVSFRLGTYISVVSIVTAIILIFLSYRKRKFIHDVLSYAA